jgi:hypothetical protein
MSETPGTDLTITTISIPKSLHNRLLEMSSRIAEKIGVRQTMASVVSSALQSLERELDASSSEQVTPNPAVQGALTINDVQHLIEVAIARHAPGNVSAEGQNS